MTESEKQLIAFDCDGTLIDLDGNPKDDIIALLKALSRGNHIIVWSGGGKEYAESIVGRLGLENYIQTCHSKTEDLRVDIAIDDQMVKLGVHNVCIEPRPVYF